MLMRKFLALLVPLVFLGACRTTAPTDTVLPSRVAYTEITSKEDVYVMLSELEKELEKLAEGTRAVVSDIPMWNDNISFNPEYQIAHDSYMFANGYTSSIQYDGRIHNQWLKALSPNSRYVFTHGGMSKDDFMSRYIYFDDRVTLNLQALAIYNALCLKYGNPIHTELPTSEHVYRLYIQKLPDSLVILSVSSRTGYICLEFGPSITVQTPDGAIKIIE
jgi:hypothetical protein